MTFEGAAPPLRRAARGARVAPAPRPALPPAARRGPARPGPPGLGRRPALQPALPPAPHRAARARAATSELKRLAGPACSRQQLDRRQPAVGDLARRRARGRPLRAHRQDAPRARRRRLGRRHHDRPVRRRARPGADRRRPSGRGRPKPPPSAGAAARRRARRARDRTRPRAAARVRALDARAAPRRRRARRERRRASASTLRATLRPAPPSPLNVRIGPHRRYTWVDARPRTSSRRSRTSSAARSTTSCSPRSRSRSGAGCAATAFPTDGPRAARVRPGVGARRRRARRARQPRRGDVRAAAGRARGPRGGLPPRARGDGRAEGVRPGGRRAGHHPARRLRAADDPQPGRAPAGPPALVQRRRDERARARSSRSTSSGAGCCACTPSSRSRSMQALGIAIMSYDGRLGFGLLGDYDALADLDDLAEDLEHAIGRSARDGRRAAATFGTGRAPHGARQAASGAPATRVRRGGAHRARRSSSRSPARVGLIAFFQSRDDADDRAAAAARPASRRPTETDADARSAATSSSPTASPADERGAARAGRGDRRRPDDPALVDAGQAVIVRRRPTQGERIVAHAYKRRLAAPTPQRSGAARVRRVLARARRAGTMMRAMLRSRSPRSNAIVGDIAGNEEKIVDAARPTRARPAPDLVLFPECALSGYPAEDLLLKEHFLRDAASALDRIAEADARTLVAIVGFPERAQDVYNSAAVLADGEVAGHLPQDAPAELRRLRRGALLPGRRPARRSSRSTARCIGLTICEDIWQPGPPASLEALAGATLIVNISASPYEHGKPARREQMIVQRARDYLSPDRVLRARRRPGRARLRRPLVRLRPRGRDPRPLARLRRGPARRRRRPVARPRRARLRDTRHRVAARDVRGRGADDRSPARSPSRAAPSRRSAGARRAGHAVPRPRRRGLRRARDSACATTSRRTASTHVVLGLSRRDRLDARRRARRRRARRRPRQRGRHAVALLVARARSPTRGCSPRTSASTSTSCRSRTR